MSRTVMETTADRIIAELLQLIDENGIKINKDLRLRLRTWVVLFERTRGSVVKNDLIERTKEEQ